MTTPYRDSPTAHAAAEWVYIDEGRREDAGRQMLHGVLLSFPASGVGALAGGLAGSLTAIFACVAWGCWRWGRTRDVARVVLRIAAGTLDVRRGKTRSSLPLRRLGSVRMETKTINAVVGGRGARVQPPRDVARIVLVVDGGTVPLSDDFFSDSLTTEQFDGLLSFLRSNGWCSNREE